MSKNTFLVFFISFILIPLQVFAQCDPKDDPCAPKKDPSQWDKSLAFGFNKTSGNSDTTLVTIGSKFLKDFDGEIYDFGASFNYGDDKAREESGLDKTSRNDFRANGSYSQYVTDSSFLGFGTRFLYDEIADVDYRVMLDPTFGHYFIKDSTYKFKLEGGPSYVFEKVGDQSNDYFAPRIGDRFDWAISCTSKIYQTADVLFDVSDSENVLVVAEVGVEAALNSSLSLVFSVRENYDNVPAEGRKKDDLMILTALKVTL